MALAAVALAGCNERAQTEVHTGGDPGRGSLLVDEEACGSCHVIPDKAQGNGLVGPPLAGIARRAVIAGLLPNTPDNMTRWLQSPQSVVPGNAMPNMGLTQQQARDITAYLYTLD